MSQWQGNPQDGPHTYRPGDEVPPDSVIGNSEFWPHGGQQPPVEPPKTKRSWRTPALVAGALIVGVFVAASLAAEGSPDAKAPVVITSQAGTPVAPKPAAKSSTSSTSQPSASSKPSPKVTHKPAPKLTAGQEQAIGTAEDYLSMGTGFSKSGLIRQLEFEQFSKADATYAVNHVGANWNEQAALSAKGYLDTSHFSRSGLIEQLVYEGFTHKQAVYGVNKAGL